MGDISGDAAGSSHRYPDWVMLDPHTRLNYPRPTLDYPEEHFRATHAYAETSKGDPVRVSFRAVPPPGTSRVYVRWAPPPEGGEEEDRWDKSYGGEPMILAAHGNSILLQITTLESNGSDFFVYTVHSVGQPPSLQRLPGCDHDFFTSDDGYRGLEHMFDLEGIGLLCDAVTGEFAVADLIVVPTNAVHGHGTPVEAGLCVYRSGRPEDGWQATRPVINHENGQGRDLIFWKTDAVVPFGDSLCYVDYLRGVLFADVLSACPQLRYVRLPVNIPAGDTVDHETGMRVCPEASRSVCVTDGGATMKFVEVVSSTVFVSGSRSPASSSFTINVWRLKQDSMTWEKEASMEDTELWSLQGYGVDLPRAAPKYPLVSMKEPEVICFVLRDAVRFRPGDADGDDTWVIVVDMLSKTLRSSSRYASVYQNCFESDGNMASASLFTNLAFMACEFSKYIPTCA